MLTWLAAAWSAIKVIFTSGVLWKAILAGIKNETFRIVFNPQVQAKAFELVLKLHNDKTKTNAQKAKEFNKEMYAFLKEIGIVDNIRESVINFLRELACNVLHIKLDSGAIELGEEKK